MSDQIPIIDVFITNPNEFSIMGLWSSQLCRDRFDSIEAPPLYLSSAFSSYHDALSIPLEDIQTRNGKYELIKQMQFLFLFQYME